MSTSYKLRSTSNNYGPLRINHGTLRINYGPLRIDYGPLRINHGPFRINYSPLRTNHEMRHFAYKNTYNEAIFDFDKKKNDSGKNVLLVIYPLR